MALTPQQIQEARAKIGLTTSSSPSAPVGKSGVDWDKVQSQVDAHKDPRAGLVQQSQAAPEHDGFFKSVVKGVASPFLRTGVTLYDGAVGIGKAIGGGNGDGTYDASDFGKSRDLGYFGKVEPTGFATNKSMAHSILDTAGVGLELGTDFAGGGAGKDLVQNAGEASIKGLIKQGAKQGALIGGSSGLATSIQGDNQSVGKTVASTLGGAAVGGLVGGATGGITGVLKGKPWASADESVKNTWEMIQPKLNASETADARVAGKITKSGILKTAELQPKGQDLKMIEVAHPYVNGAKSEEEAISKMQGGIADEADKLRAGLDQSDAIWSQNNLKGAINKIEKPHLLSGDLEKSYDKTLNVVLDKAKGADKNLSGLLDVRQEFDAEVRKQYPNLYNGSESMTAIKQAVKSTRQAINDLISRKLPAGTTLDGINFKDSLLKQSLLYDAIDNVAAKGDKVGSNILNRAAKTPIGKAAQYGLEGVGAYEGAKMLFGK